MTVTWPGSGIAECKQAACKFPRRNQRHVLKARIDKTAPPDDCLKQTALAEVELGPEFLYHLIGARARRGPPE